MVWLDPAVLDTVLGADSIEEVTHVTRPRAGALSRRMTELSAIVSEHCVDLVRHVLDKISQKLAGNGAGGPRLQTSQGRLRGSIDHDVQMSLTLFGTRLGESDIEVYGRVAIEIPLGSGLGHSRPAGGRRRGAGTAGASLTGAVARPPYSA